MPFLSTGSTVQEITFGADVLHNKVETNIWTSSVDNYQPCSEGGHAACQS